MSGEEKLECNAFDLADAAIEEAYPNFYNKEKGFWGDKKIPNFGILRGAIAKAILKERKQSNVEYPGGYQPIDLDFLRKADDV